LTSITAGVDFTNQIIHQGEAIMSRFAIEPLDNSTTDVASPASHDRDLTASEMEFMQAMCAYKESSGRMFPTWSEVLEVLQGLGYQKQVGTVSPPGHTGSLILRGGACVAKGLNPR
jgi:hypothetical protein